MNAAYARPRHGEASRAVALAEARYRAAEAEDAELAIDVRHGALTHPGTPPTDRAGEELSPAIAAVQEAALAVEEAERDPPTVLRVPEVGRQLRDTA